MYDEAHPNMVKISPMQLREWCRNAKADLDETLAQYRAEYHEFAVEGSARRNERRRTSWWCRGVNLLWNTVFHRDWYPEVTPESFVEWEQKRRQAYRSYSYQGRERSYAEYQISEYQKRNNTLAALARQQDIYLCQKDYIWLLNYQPVQPKGDSAK